MTAAILTAPAYSRQREILRLHWDTGKKWMILPHLTIIGLFLAGCWLLDLLLGHFNAPQQVLFAANIVTIIFYVRAVLVSFRFAAGLSVTRWEFYSATVIFAIAYWLAGTVGLCALTAAERMTGGWGINAGVLSSGGSLWPALLDTVELSLGLITLASLFLLLAAAYQRWSWTGAVLTFLGYAALATLLGGLSYVLERSISSGFSSFFDQAVFLLTVPAEFVMAWLILRRSIIG